MTEFFEKICFFQKTVEEGSPLPMHPKPSRPMLPPSKARLLRITNYELRIIPSFCPTPSLYKNFFCAFNPNFHKNH